MFVFYEDTDYFQLRETQQADTNIICSSPFEEDAYHWTKINNKSFYSIALKT